VPLQRKLMFSQFMNTTKNPTVLQYCNTWVKECHFFQSQQKYLIRVLFITTLAVNIYVN